MYPHRLVVDANCINAKGRLTAMAVLEQYHHAGALELIVTSTLQAELDNGSIQAIKAKLYQSVGAYPLFVPGERSAQSATGTTVRPSLLPLLHAELFGPNLQGHALLRGIRDCLHLDQAQMNAADIFVTNDKRLYAAEAILAAQGVTLAVLSPERALSYVQTYLRSTIGSDDVNQAKAHAEGLGSLILGSNSFLECTFVAAETQEHLASFKIQNGLIHVEAAIRDETGATVVHLHAGQAPEFFSRGMNVMMSGPGSILAGEGPMHTVVVSSEHRVFLAIRTTHTLRAVVYGLELRDQNGKIVASVQRDQLVLHGAALVL